MTKIKITLFPGWSIPITLAVRILKKYTILALFSKSDHEGERGSKIPKIPPRGLWMTLKYGSALSIFMTLKKPYE